MLNSSRSTVPPPFPRSWPRGPVPAYHQEYLCGHQLVAFAGIDLALAAGRLGG
jgi:hypothetical protein